MVDLFLPDLDDTPVVAHAVELGAETDDDAAPGRQVDLLRLLIGGGLFN